MENEKKISEERKKLETQLQAFQEIEKLMIEIDTYDDSGYDLVAEVISIPKSSNFFHIKFF